MAYSPSTRTVNDVMRAVKRTFGDESGVQLEDADIFMWINDAQDEIVKRNKIIKTTTTAASVIGTREYSFPNDSILQIESLHYAGQKLPNIPFAQAEQEIISTPATVQTGAPTLWWEWGGVFTLWPTPTAVDQIKLYYTKRPARITAPTDSLTVPDKYYKQVVDYVLQQAYEMDEEPEMSQMKGAQFDSGLLDQAEEERQAQQLTYSTITFVD